MIKRYKVQNIGLMARNTSIQVRYKYRNSSVLIPKYALTHTNRFTETDSLQFNRSVEITATKHSNQNDIGWHPNYGKQVTR